MKKGKSVASQERLEYFISAAFKDEGVRQAMQSFAKLNAESAKVVRELEKMTAASNKAGSSIRDSRTGFAQVGMQINQFGTQIASGTSVTTAFVQQIGDVGWALSNMKGVLGAVGSFLAGPWGVAVMAAAFALDKLINTTDDGEQVNKKYEKSLQAARDALFNYRVETAKTRKELLDLYEAQLVGFELQWRKAATEVGQYGREVQRTQGILDKWASTPLDIVAKAWIDNKKAVQNYTAAQENERNASAQLLGAETALHKLKTGFAADDARSAAAAERATNRQEKAAETLQNRRESLINTIQNQINVFTSEDTAIGKAKNKLNAFNDAVAELKKIGGQGWLDAHAAGIKTVQDTLEAGANGTTYALEELDKLDKKIKGMSENNIDPVKKLRNEFAVLTALLSSGAFAGMDVNAVTEAINQVSDSLNKLDIKKRNDEYIKSFEAVGQSVSDAFKGMLTSGMSWKDGMKGIINAVIDELWRVFVVQQIVGMVKNALGKVFKIPIPIPGNANGTPSWQGGMTWVGERGPELVNLPRGSQVIPAHRASQMGTGGGVTVNVDARGSADPAAVRAQVQQGILEAAPAIVAAAQQRTVSGLHRPKLGGVMQ